MEAHSFPKSNHLLLKNSILDSCFLFSIVLAGAFQLLFRPRPIAATPTAGMETVALTVLVPLCCCRLRAPCAVSMGRLVS